MWPCALKRAALWICIAALVYSFGCILSPEEEAAPPVIKPVTFEDLTEKEHVIINLVNSYKALLAEKYEELLLRAEDIRPSEDGGGTYGTGYYWFNQTEDLTELEGEEFIEGLEDRDRTYNMFRAAQQNPVDPEKHPIIDKLTLTLSDATWQSVPEIFNQPCSDCWETLRVYEIWLYFGDDRIHGYDEVKFRIVPVMNGDTKIYKIAVAYDLFAD
jgi:hypothetical protein